MKILSVSSYSTTTPVRRLRRLVELDGEERRHVRHARRLLHVVRDDDDRVALLELHHQVLDPPGRDRVQGGARLVHQQHVGLRGERAGDAQALLLAAGHAERVRLQAVLGLVPQRRAAQGGLDDLVGVALHAHHARPEGDVVVDRLRERVRLLEDHPDPLAHLHGVDRAVVEVLAVVDDLAVDARARDQVVHPVQAADERRLAAARRPDQRGDLVLGDLHRDVADRPVLAVVDVHVAHVEDRLGQPPRLLATAARSVDGSRPLGRVGRDGPDSAGLVQLLGHVVITTSAHSGFSGRSRRRSSARASSSARGWRRPPRSRTRGSASVVQLKIWIGSAVNESNSPLGLKRGDTAAPMISSGAVSPIARESARITPVAMPAIEPGRTCFQIVCHCVAPSASEPFADRRRDGADRLAGDDDHHRQDQQRERDPARQQHPAHRQRAADDEGQAEDPVDHRGDRGEVLDVDLDQAVPPAARGPRTPRGRPPSPRPAGSR